MDAEQSNDLGIIRELGDLPAEAVISEQALAKIFDRHRVSIKRAIERGELPPSIRLFGEPVWTVKALRDHLAERLDAARKESEQLQKRISQFSA
ncbi:MAG: hypothetical protein P8Z79_22845 [Sedimentisphaerales bacterium]|jgi:hypothetical protein